MPRKKEETETSQTETVSGTDTLITSENSEEDIENPVIPQTDTENAEADDASKTPDLIDDAVDDGNTVFQFQSVRDTRVLSIDEQRSVATEADKARDDLIDLTESLKAEIILTGTVQGLESQGETNTVTYAVLYHGDYKVIIPESEMVESSEGTTLDGDAIHFMVTKRMGAEIDYIVKGIDEEARIAVASRVEAMRKKRRRYYFASDRDGKPRIRPGIYAEARVVAVIRSGAFVDLFGVETFIPLHDLSYQRWADATVYLQSGQRVLTKIMEVEVTGRNRVRVVASVKETTADPYKQALRRYTVGNRYVGTVSMVDTNGVFVALNGGVDCLCSYPRRGRPPRGARVTVKILGVNWNTNRIWGAITHIAIAR